jgi:transposase-like protein
MKAEVRPNVTADELEDFIMQNIEEKSSLMTDNAKAYQRAKGRYVLETVDHGKGEYVRGKAHINTIETFISHLKRSTKGTYKVISKEHLQSYVDSFVFHYNNRHNDKERFSSLLEILSHSVKPL